MMAHKSKQRLYEESQLKERVIAMERRKKKVNDEMVRRKQLILIKQDEERLAKLLKQRKQEELRKRHEIDLLHKRETELKRELEEIEKEGKLDFEGIVNARQFQGERRQGGHEIGKTELLKAINAWEKDRGDKPVVRPKEKLPFTGRTNAKDSYELTHFGELEGV